MGPPPLTVAPSPDLPSDYEQKNVHEVYNMIATHFSATRYKQWPSIAAFLHTIPPGSLGLDAGCGNGKYLPAWDGSNGSSMMIGLDRSDRLLSLAQRVGYVKEKRSDAQDTEEEADDERRREVMIGDVLDCGGVRPGSMDFAISIATLHHLSTPERRLEAMRTFIRCLVPDHGRGMIYVWALEQGEGARRVVPSAKTNPTPSSSSVPVSPSTSYSSMPVASKAAIPEPAVDDKAQDVFVPWVLSKEAPKTVKDALKPGAGKPTKQKKQPGSKKKPSRAQPDQLTDETDGPTAVPAVSEPTPVEEITPPARPASPPQVFQRYYHLFKSSELSSLVKQACELDQIHFVNSLVEGEDAREGKEIRQGQNWVRLVKEEWEKDNWYCEIQRGIGPF